MKLRMYFRGLGLGLIVAALVLTLSGGFGAGKETLTDSEIIARAKELGMEEKKSTLAAEIKNSEKDEEKIDIENAAAQDERETEEAAAGDEAEGDAEEVVEEVQDEKVDGGAEDGNAEDTPEENVVDDAKINDVKADEPAEKVEEEPKESPKESPETKVETPEDKKVDEKAPAKQDDNNAEKPDSSILEKKAEELAGKVKSKSKTTITISRGVGSDTVAKLLEKGGAIDSAADFDRYLCQYDYDNKINTGTFEIPEGATYEEIAKIITSR